MVQCTPSYIASKWGLLTPFFSGSFPLRILLIQEIEGRIAFFPALQQLPISPDSSPAVFLAVLASNMSVTLLLLKRSRLRIGFFFLTGRGLLL